MAYTLHYALYKIVRKNPEHTALQFEGQKMSYAELWQRSGQIAAALKAAGIVRGDRVALYMNRSLDSMAAVFGILRAGGAYVPFDVTAPQGMLASVIEDCHIKNYIVDQVHTESLQSIFAKDDIAEPNYILGYSNEEATQKWNDLPDEVIPDLDDVLESDTSVFYYTSGSTGKPKGVAHDHRSMLANVEWALEEFSIVPEDKLSNVTSHHFDLSWLEMFVSMAAGATLVMIPESDLLFPDKLAKKVESEKLTVWVSVPSVLLSMIDRSNLTKYQFQLRLIMFAGERFPTKHLRTLMEQVKGPRYVNMYGTTETHIAAFWPIKSLPRDDTPIPIGKACSHVNLGIVDSDGHLLPDGEEGELAIRGPSMMQCYWGMEEKTASVIRKVKMNEILSVDYYHTGDIAKKNEHGDIEVIGRNDRRVKVRGFLVDLDEVEAVILSAESVLEVAVVPITPENNFGFLAAVAILKPEFSELITGASLRAYAGESLPVYAVPERVIIMDDLPRTGSLKISRKHVESIFYEAEQALKSVSETDAIPVDEIIEEFIREQVLEGDEEIKLGQNENLLEQGVFTSIDIIRLVAFLENRFNIVIPNTEFSPENFLNISLIIEMVERLRNA